MANKKESHADDQSVKKLLTAVTLAVAAGLLILVLQILPAQYGIDLTGFGNYVGLMKRYETQQYYQQLKNTTEKHGSVDIEIPAGEELEYKLYMLEGDQVEYNWTAGEGEIFFEFHGEPKGIHAAGYESYSSDTAGEDGGTFTATFEGTHGWYWRNDSDSPITISLETQGKYSNVGIKTAAFSRN